MSDQGGVVAAGAGDAGAASVAPNAGAQSAPIQVSGTTTASDWTTGFNDELKGYAQTKGFSGPQAVLESYRNFEKLQGVPQDRLLKLPEKDDDPSWGQIWDRLGKPKEAKEYAVEVPKDYGDEKFAEWAKNTFHELNMPRKQAEALAKKWNEYIGAQLETGKSARQAESVQQQASLKKEWGAAFEQNIDQAGRAARQLGFDAETINKLEASMGFAGVMKLMHSLSAKVGEDTFVGSSQNGGSFKGMLTPEQAMHRISSLKGDPDFTRRYINGESAPREEMERLHKMAYPDLG